MSKAKSALRSATCLATLLTLTTHSAFAQEGTNTDGDAKQSAVQRILETVTITATKQKDAENVQDIATAVTAFNADTLDVLKVRDFEDVSYSSPNVTLTDIGTTKGGANFAIRGLGINSSIISIDPTVGVTVDGVPLGITSGVVFDMFDLGSIEILRGPQGILQGRNTVGGLVAVNTGNPTDTFQYDFKVSAESPIDSNRGGLNSYVQGAVSGPLVEGKLNGKLAAYYNNDEGYFKNLANNENHGEGDAKIVRGALEYLPSETFSILAKLEYSEFTGDGPSAQNRSIFSRDTFDFSIDNEGFYETDTTFASLRMDWDVPFGDGQITNITGYRQYNATTSSDIDALPLPLFDGLSATEQDQLSNELRYNGSFGDLTVTTGAFYMKQSLVSEELRQITSAAVNPALPPGQVPFPGGGDQDHLSYGLYAQGEYQFTDKLSAQLGVRYSYEEKDVEITYVIPALLRGISNCSVLAGTCPVDFQDKNDWSGFTPKVAVEYDVTDSSLLYASYNRGFRSGGYNFRITDPTTFQTLAATANNGELFFDEETIDSYEIGYKYQSEGGRVQLNTAAFFNKASDLQRELNVASASSGTSQLILNTADADIKGIEFEGRLALADNFLVTANLGYIDAEYTDIRFPISVASIADIVTGNVSDADFALELPRTPEMTYGIGFVWDQDLGSAGSLETVANFQHRDENFYSDNNLGVISAVDMLGANITWNTPKDGVSISLYGKNLLDESFSGNDTLTPFSGNPSNPIGSFAPLNKGRLIGLELSIKG